jgi:hypothetical protein
LALVPMPADLLPGGGHTCGENYSTSNHLLDALVNGCTWTIFPLISKTQPDAIDPSQPVAGQGPNASGAPYVLTLTGNTVTGCTDKSGKAVPAGDFQKCLNAAAYSSFFAFTSDRVIMK